jgi:hypothetical protein
MIAFNDHSDINNVLPFNRIQDLLKFNTSHKVIVDDTKDINTLRIFQCYFKCGNEWIPKYCNMRNEYTGIPGNENPEYSDIDLYRTSFDIVDFS